MNSQFAFAFLLSVCAFGLIAAIPATTIEGQCGSNEEFHACGTACPPTCKNPRPSGLCTKQCVIGCFCKQGYLRHENGQCVHETNCGDSVPETKPIPEPHQIMMPGPVVAIETKPASVCAQNEEYRQCKGCDATCENRDPICHKMCIPGCSCKEGHVRDVSGSCISETRCLEQPKLPVFVQPEEPKCGENEIFRSCGSACPPTCEDPHPSPICSHECVVGCFCVEGYLRDAKGVCVPAADCVETNPLLPNLQSAIKRILPLRVPPPHGQQCPTDREEYSTLCGSVQNCINDCDSPPVYIIHGVPQISEKCKAIECAPACACKHPYYRNKDGQCVERKECHKMQ